MDDLSRALENLVATGSANDAYAIALQQVHDAEHAAPDAVRSRIEESTGHLISLIEARRDAYINNLKAQLMVQQDEARAEMERAQRAVEAALAVAQAEGAKLAATQAWINDVTTDIQNKVNAAADNFAKMIAGQRQALAIMNAVDVPFRPFNPPQAVEQQ